MNVSSRWNPEWRGRLLAVLISVVVGLSAKGQTVSDGHERPDDLIYRVFDIEDFDLRRQLGLYRDPAPNPFNSPGYHPPERMEPGNLEPLFLDSWRIYDHSQLFREAGLDLPDGSALTVTPMPLLFVRAPEEVMARIEQLLNREPPGDHFENLWCRATILAGVEAAESRDEPEELLKKGTVLSDLEVFSSGNSEIRSGSLTRGPGVADPTAWGSSLRLDAEGIGVEVSFRSPAIGDSGPRELDWHGKFEKSAIGTTQVVPITFTGGNHDSGALLLQFEPITAIGWTLRNEELRQEKEALWKKLGPGFMARPFEYHPEKNDTDWARSLSRTYFYDKKSNTVYFETYLPLWAVGGDYGSATLPHREASPSGFRDIFSTGKLYDLSPTFETFGVVFRPDDVAVYSVGKSTLFARTEPKQAALIEACLATIHRYGDAKLIRMRVATFEVAGDLGTSFRRTPGTGWELVELPNSRTLLARSGQRAKMTATGVAAPYTFEIDPVLGPEEFTIDINLSYTQPGDFSANLQASLYRGQPAILPIGPPKGTSETRRVLAIRPDLVNAWGSLAKRSAHPAEPNDSGPKPATTPWEKRGAEFKLIPIGPPPKPATPSGSTTPTPAP